MKKSALLAFGLAIVISPMIAMAKTTPALKSPEKNVLCDKYLCVSGKDGVSIELTKKYIGEKQASNIKQVGDFDKTQMTFANGIFCDTQTQKCHVDRYFENGQRSEVSKKYTKILFGE